MKIGRETAAKFANRTAASINKFNYPCNTQKSQRHFDQHALPMPITVLKRLGIKTSTYVNSAGYFVLTCPFHKEGKEKKPSLNLHTISGHYKCHACGAKGGHILAFYRAVTDKGFVEAAKDLGAWRDNNE